MFLLESVEWFWSAEWWIVAVERVLPHNTHSLAPSPSTAVFWQHLHFIPSTQGYHCLSRNGCSRLRSDTATQSLGLLPNLRSTDCNKVRREDGEKKFENPTKAGSNVIVRWHDYASHSSGWDRQCETAGESRCQVVVLKEEPSSGLLPRALRLERPWLV